MEEGRHEESESRRLDAESEKRAIAKSGKSSALRPLREVSDRGWTLTDVARGRTLARDTGRHVRPARLADGRCPLTAAAVGRGASFAKGDFRWSRGSGAPASGGVHLATGVG